MFIKALLDLWRGKYYANPVVRDHSDSSRGTIEILVGHHIIKVSEEQARNLWGELGHVLRMRKFAHADLMPTKKELEHIGREWELAASKKGHTILQPTALSDEHRQALLDWADILEAEQNND